METNLKTFSTIVIGGSGATGRHLVNNLLSSNHISKYGYFSSRISIFFFCSKTCFRNKCMYLDMNIGLVFILYLISLITKSYCCWKKRLWYLELSPRISEVASSQNRYFYLNNNKFWELPQSIKYEYLKNDNIRVYPIYSESLDFSKHLHGREVCEDSKNQYDERYNLPYQWIQITSLFWNFHIFLISLSIYLCLLSTFLILSEEWQSSHFSSYWSHFSILFHHWLNWFSYDIGFCNLGTTRADAGSDEAFRLVDYTYALNFATLCKNDLG